MRESGVIRTARFLKTAVMIFVVVCLVGAAQRLGCNAARKADRAEGEVTYVYDGDTIEVSGAGKVRLLGIDALDMHNEEKVQSQVRHLRMEPEQVIRWGRRAEDFLRDEILNREVRLEFGPERRGDYGRLLAYVYREGDGQSVSVNRLLLRNGLATAYRAFDHPKKREFIETEKEARRKETGLWKQASSTW